MRSALQLAIAGTDPVARGDADPAATPPGAGSPAPASNDRRFERPAWQRWPFNLYAPGFAMQQDW